MRDALLLAFILVCLVGAVRYPFAGLLVWAWFSFMTPHQMAYGVYGLPLNVIIAGATILAAALSGAWRQFRFDGHTALLILFAVWLTIAQQASLDPVNSAPIHDRFIKLLIFILLAGQLATSKLRVHALVWMFVLSIGYFAAKGAVFTIATLGQFRVQGLPNTILEDNNHTGIAIAATLPLILYLHGQAANRLARWGLVALLISAAFAIVGTQSRGAFVSLVVFAAYFWMRSRRKLMILAGLGALLVPAIAFMPASWTERMRSIQHATEDASFMGRVDAWIINTKLALAHPLTGVGLRNAYLEEIADTVEPNRTPRAAHSIYFEVLGGSGFVGLGLYLWLIAHAFVSTLRLQSPARNGPPRAPWTQKFGYYAQMSLAVFCVGGATVSLEMWEGYLLVMALIAASRKLEARQSFSAEGHRASIGWRMIARGFGRLIAERGARRVSRANSGSGGARSYRSIDSRR
jgi:probable O-glycosylation ligase (exosortase A-associated)